jgi:outer membrane receptor protein involved in Fe transport
VINKIPLAFSLNQCLTTGNPVFCANVVRSPSGILFGTSVQGGGYISGTAVNIASQKVEGVDLQATYDIALHQLGIPDGYGDLQFNFIGSALIKSENTPTPGAHTYDCAGLYGPTCQTVNPNWRHTLRTTWKTPWNVLASLQWRYIGSTDLETNTNDETLTNGRIDTFDATLHAVSYIDLAVIWDVRKWLEVRAGVNNLFDKDPQIINSSIVGTGLPNAYPTYDFLGREIFVGFTTRF